MKQWNFRPKAQCPFCLQPDKDTEHVLQCQHVSALQIWDEQKKLIEESLTKWDTERMLHFALCQDLQNWRLNLPFTPIQLLLQQIQHIVD